MQGLKISKKFYEEYGEGMLREGFPEIFGRAAVGLCGQGSECFGYDDEISRDHDFYPGFCIWLCESDFEKYGFALERAYSKLPRKFMGLERSVISPVGGNRHGVFSTAGFYKSFLGTAGYPENLEAWLYIPSHSLASVTNGEVFCDNLGEFSAIRQRLLCGYPEDIRLKKLAAHTVMMAQSGQYNFARCISHGERGAAQLAMFEFVRHAISAVYLLNNKYEPFYKWAYRGMRGLAVLGDTEPLLSSLTELDNSPASVEVKCEVIEDISFMIIAELRREGITDATCNNLETHAYSIQSRIRDNNLRNMHIMDGI